MISPVFGFLHRQDLDGKHYYVSEQIFGHRFLDTIDLPGWNVHLVHPIYRIDLIRLTVVVKYRIDEPSPSKQ